MAKEKTRAELREEIEKLKKENESIFKDKCASDREVVRLKREVLAFKDINLEILKERNEARESNSKLSNRLTEAGEKYYKMEKQYNEEVSYRKLCEDRIGELCSTVSNLEAKIRVKDEILNGSLLQLIVYHFSNIFGK